MTIYKKFSCSVYAKLLQPSKYDNRHIIDTLGSVTKGAQAQLKGDQSVEGGAASKESRGRRARRR